MKKTLILSTIAGLLMSSTAVFAAPQKAAEVKPPVKQEAKKTFEKREHKKNMFDERMKMTEEQKKQAYEIRMKGHEKIKPIIKQLKDKKQEAEMVKMSRIAVQEQEKRLAVIDADIKKLKQEARTIREENNKEFEAILTPEQKKEFQKIKKEGKEKYKSKKRKHCEKNKQHK